MSEQTNEQRSNGGGGWLLPALIMISLCLALLVGVAGGAMLNDLPAPAPETLNYVPSVQTFADTGSCADPTAPVPNYEVGVGGVLPPCWSVWTREQQNAFLRSH